MAYWSSLGNFAQPVWGHAVLGEIYLQLALGAPPPLRLLVQNFWFLLVNMPMARRRAKFHFEEAVRKSREYNMPGCLAKALYGLGVLAQAKKRHAEARSYYEEALRAAETSGLNCADRIRTALTAF